MDENTEVQIVKCYSHKNNVTNLSAILAAVILVDHVSQRNILEVDIAILYYLTVSES